jgi:hypothetical protein
MRGKYVVDRGNKWPQTVVNVEADDIESGRRKAAEHVASRYGADVRDCLKKTRLAFVEVNTDLSDCVSQHDALERALAA